MLILTRRVGERVFIGDDIQLTVISVVGNQVRLGVHAPRDIEVHREEIYRKVQNEKVQNEQIQQEQVQKEQVQTDNLHDEPANAPAEPGDQYSGKTGGPEVQARSPTTITLRAETRHVG